MRPSTPCLCRPRIVTQFVLLLIASSIAVFAPQVWSEDTVIPATSVSITQDTGENPAGSRERQALATPTHHQTGLIKANVAGQPEASITCFCLTPENRVLAGCVGEAGEVRVFDAEGKYLETWSTPVKPEAIFARSDGAIFLAGQGAVVKLSPAGKLELRSQSPHADAVSNDLDEIREEVASRAKRQAEVFAQQTQVYDQMLERVDQQINTLNEQLANLDAQTADDEDAADAEPATAGAAQLLSSPVGKNRQMLERRLTMLKQMKGQYEQTKFQWEQQAAQYKPDELTDEQIEQQVKASIEYKLRASSISAAGDQVFLATHAATGYGFDVWKIDEEFAGGERIITGLSGCCGQMDVKANENGLYVAENSKHRVCCYDRDGKMIREWGHGARTGLEGFGSCCNPMNVAFGPDASVYTAEDNTGRIKRYSPDGKLLGLVGAVDLVPGCKNVSIAVSADGRRVYMLDMTRGHIVKMEAYPPGEAPAPVKYEEENAETQSQNVDALSFDTTPDRTPDAGGGIAKGIMRLFGIGN